MLLLFVLGWLMLGPVNVYLAGVIDRRLLKGEGYAPLGFLAIAGPFGLCTCTIMLLISPSLKFSISFIDKIYQAGNKK